MQSSRWVRVIRSTSQTQTSLVCFPFAGGGASIFNKWQSLLPTDMNLYAIQYPGRENRIGEKPFDRIEELIPPLTKALQPYLHSSKTIFFGYSLGALIAYETVLHLSATAVPTHLFLGATRAPHCPPRREIYHNLPTNSFWDRIGKMNGTATEILENQEFRRRLEPMLRADFKMAEVYKQAEPRPVSCPITAIGGLEDEFALPEDIEEWRSYTTASFETHQMSGGHFFINDHLPELLNIIAQKTVLEN